MCTPVPSIGGLQASIYDFLAHLNMNDVGSAYPTLPSTLQMVGTFKMDCRSTRNQHRPAEWNSNLYLKLNSSTSRTVYISHTGATEGTVVQAPWLQALPCNATRQRTESQLFNERSSYLTLDWVPDGLKVAVNGLCCECLLSRRSYSLDTQFWAEICSR